MARWHTMGVGAPRTMPSNATSVLDLVRQRYVEHSHISMYVWPSQSIVGCRHATLDVEIALR